MVACSPSRARIGRTSVRVPSSWRCSPPQLTNSAPVWSTMRPSEASHDGATSASGSRMAAHRPWQASSPTAHASAGSSDGWTITFTRPSAMARVAGHRLVGRAAVDHHHLDPGEGLGQNSGHGAADHLGAVSHRNDDAEPWSHGPHCATAARRERGPVRRVPDSSGQRDRVAGQERGGSMR